MTQISALNQAMTSLTQAEVLIALVVAAHAGVLAVRLAASLYRAGSLGRGVVAC